MVPSMSIWVPLTKCRGSHNWTTVWAVPMNSWPLSCPRLPGLPLRPFLIVTRSMSLKLVTCHESNLTNRDAPEKAILLAGTSVYELDTWMCNDVYVCIRFAYLIYIHCMALRCMALRCIALQNRTEQNIPIYILVLYLPPYLPTYLQTYRRTCLPTVIHTCIILIHCMHCARLYTSDMDLIGPSL